MIVCCLIMAFQANGQVTINTYTVWGVPGGTTTFNPNGNLVVTDTLIIYGNLYLDNDEDLVISSSGVVIVIGDFDAKNKVDLGLGGYFIVTGEFNKNGGQGDIIDNGGSMFIFDDTPQWGSPPAPPDDYGDEDDIINDPIFDFFNDIVQTVCNLSINLVSISRDLCNGLPPDGAIDISVSGSVAPPPAIVYSWHDDESNTYTTQDITGVDTGNYYITIHQGFCFASDTFTVYSLASAGAISGSNEVCINSSETYSITAIPGASSYVWTASNGATGTSSSDSIEITFPNLGSVTISVYGVNSCGVSQPATMDITVNARPVPAISGPDTACVGNTVQFETENGMSAYTWTITAGAGTITPPGNTYTAQVTWSNVTGQYEDRVVTVNYSDSNGCAASNPSQMTIRVFRIPQAGPTFHIGNLWNQ